MGVADGSKGDVMESIGTKTSAEGVDALEAFMTVESATGLCRICGEVIRGRRTNGFCGDACRMRHNRERQLARRHELMEQLKSLIAAVERELVGRTESSSGETDER